MLGSLDQLHEGIRENQAEAAGRFPSATGPEREPDTFIKAWWKLLDQKMAPGAAAPCCYRC